MYLIWNEFLKDFLLFMIHNEGSISISRVISIL